MEASLEPTPLPFPFMLLPPKLLSEAALREASGSGVGIFAEVKDPARPDPKLVSMRSVLPFPELFPDCRSVEIGDPVAP